MERLEDYKENVRDNVKEAIKEFIENELSIDDDSIFPNDEWIRDRIDYSGRITEDVDSSCPVYYSDIMELGADPEIFHHENELGPALDGETTALNIVLGSIYEVLMETAWEEIDKLKDEWQEFKEDLEEEFQKADGNFSDETLFSGILKERVEEFLKDW